MLAACKFSSWRIDSSFSFGMTVLSPKVEWSSCSFVTAAIKTTDCAPFSPSWRARQAYGGSFDFCGGY
jgi:hypothetical protein